MKLRKNISKLLHSISLLFYQYHRAIKNDRLLYSLKIFFFPRNLIHKIPGEIEFVAKKNAKAKRTKNGIEIHETNSTEVKQGRRQMHHLIEHFSHMSYVNPLTSRRKSLSTSILDLTGASEPKSSGVAASVSLGKKTVLTTP